MALTPVYSSRDVVLRSPHRERVRGRGLDSVCTVSTGICRLAGSTRARLPQEHGGQYDFLHDVGSGHGVFARILAPHFEHTHISDPGQANIEHARELVDKASLEGFTFSVAPGEQAHSAAPLHSVDMITLATAAHWTDIDKMVHSAAEALKPGGTLAIVNYRPGPTIVDNPELAALWLPIETANARDACSNPTILDAFRKTSVGLDFVPLPEDLFATELTRRININTHGLGSSTFRFGDDPHMVGSARARPEEQVVEYDLPAKEAFGWRYQVGPGWFEGFLRTLPKGAANMPIYAEKLAEMDALIRKSPSQKVVIEFVVNVLLATRK